MKLKNILNRIPRPLKACFFAVLAIVLSVVYYIALGCPTLSMRQEFRRAEKVHMVGPSKIVDTLNAEVCPYEKLIVGETEHGVCFFGRYGSNVQGTKHRGDRHYQFFYHEKTGDITFLPMPDYSLFSFDFPGYDLPVYIFTDHTQAVRAEIEVTITGTHMEASPISKFSKTFEGNATLLDSGAFRYIFTSEDAEGTIALFHLSCIFTGRNYSNNTKSTTATANVRLYDRQDQLIIEKALTLQTAAEE